MTINIEEMVECTLKEPDDFLKIRETLTRIGVASRNDILLSILKNYLHLMVNLQIFQRMIKREEIQ